MADLAPLLRLRASLGRLQGLQARCERPAMSEAIVELEAAILAVEAAADGLVAGTRDRVQGASFAAVRARQQGDYIRAEAIMAVYDALEVTVAALDGLRGAR
jgi:hypothetical protein